jgi:hypothetical protein
MPVTVQARLRLRETVGCAVRIANLQLSGRFWCARRTLRVRHSIRRYGYAFRSRAALTNTNPAPAPVILVRNAG